MTHYGHEGKKKMSKLKYLQATPKSVTLEQLRVIEPNTVMYLHEYQEFFTWTKDPSINSEQLKTIVEHAKTEGALVSKDPTAIYSELVELDGIGIKTGLVMTLAITGKIPNMIPILAKMLLDNLFTGVDNSLMQSRDESVWDKYGLYESSTIQPRDSVNNFIRAKSHTLIKEMQLTPAYNVPIDKLYVYMNSILIDAKVDGCITTKEILEQETKFNNLCKSTNEFNFNVDEVNKWISDKADYLDDDQKNAIREYLCNDMKVNLLIGIAGSGKSAVIQALWTCISELYGESLITSYMNKAVSNLKERIVEYKFGGDIMRGFVSTSMRVNFAKAESKFRSSIEKCKFLIIDECSVISSNHLKYVLNIINGMHKNVRILLVGDPSQLHPVKEHGYPFIRACELYKTNKLTGFHRSNGYDIKRIADKVRYENNLNCSKSDEVSLYGGPTNSIISTIVKKYKNAASVIDFGVITPTNGIKDEINRRVFADMAPDTIVTSYYEQQKTTKYPVKLPVLWEGAKLCVDIPIKSNDVDLVKNQIIVVKKVSKLKSIIVTESEVEYNVLNKEIENSCSIGFCMTVHKYQGSELNTCLYVTPKECGLAIRFYRQSNLVYVAVSRAKEKLIIYEIDELKQNAQEISNINYNLIDPPKRKQTF